MGGFRVEVLGRPSVRHDGIPLALPGKALALVCYLAVTGTAHPRSALASLLWGERTNERARANLRMTLTDLRRSVGGHLHVTTREVGPADGWQVDLAELDDALRHGTGGLGDGLLAGARATLLDGVEVDGAPGFDEWLGLERGEVRRRLQGRLSAQLDGCDDPARALALGRELLALDPFDEVAHRAVMTQLASSGRRAAALAQFETCRSVLAEELGVDPSPATVALRDQLLRDDAASSSTPPARGDTAVVAPPASRVAREPARSAGAAPLVGREAELARLRELLLDDACRLVTLLGPGGVGKTRLATAVAASLEGGFPDGAAVAPLASVPDDAGHDAIAGIVARALQVPPWHADAPEPLRDLLAARRQLLVLDDVEHLDVSGLVDTLLRVAPGVTLLATSRRRLGLPEEWLVDVEGLPSPPSVVADLERWPAPALFAARVRRARPAFRADDAAEAVLRICRLVEGLPLALELAADAVRSLGVDGVASAITADLDVLATEHPLVEPRQRRMRSVLDASWQLLDDRQRDQLVACSVFRGGFDAAAASAVAGASPTDLAALVDRSVVQALDGGRFDLHQLVRQYAAGGMAHGPDGPAARHAAHLASRAAALGPDTDELEPDLANLRAATAWLARHGEEGDLHDCLSALWELDARRGRFGEALASVEAALTRPTISLERAATWHAWAATAAFQLGLLDRAAAELEASFAARGEPLPHGRVAVRRAILAEAARQALHRWRPPRPSTDGTDHGERVEAFSLLVQTMYYQQRPAPILLYALREANLADRCDDPGAASCAYAELEHVLRSLGWHALGRRYGDRSDACRARAPGSPLVPVGLETRVMSHLAVGAWDRFDVDTAEALAAARATGANHRVVIWHALIGVGALYRGRFDAASAAFREGLAVRDPRDPLALLYHTSGLTDAAIGAGGDLAAVEPAQVQVLEVARSLPAPEQLKGLTVLAALRLCEGRHDAALALTRAATEVVASVRFPPVWALEAYSHLAQVWLALQAAEAGPPDEASRGARVACRQLEAFARSYPVGTPRRWWAAGWSAWLAGRRRSARANWQRSVETARQLGTPYDEARAHAALAETADDAPLAAEHRARIESLQVPTGWLLHLRPREPAADASLTAG
jgi:predicted ATPase/DNA-binding SARP family transcriptional activator